MVVSIIIFTMVLCYPVKIFFNKLLLRLRVYVTLLQGLFYFFLKICSAVRISFPFHIFAFHCSFCHCYLEKKTEVQNRICNAC